MFQPDEVINGTSGLDQQRNLIDTFVYTFVSHTLRPPYLSALGMERELDDKRRCTGIIAGMGTADGSRTAVRQLQLFEAFGRQSGRTDGEIEDLGDGSADSPFVFHVVAPDHIVGNDASLTIGRVGR